MAATVDSRVDPGPLAGVRRASFGQCGMDFATTTMGTAAFRRLSNAADKASEARNRISAQFELGAITALPVKRLSEELAAVLKKRDSWSASVSPLPLSLSQPDIVKAQTGRSPCEAPSCSSNSKASVTSGPVKEPAALQAQYQTQYHQPWYSLLTCRLLSFIGGGGPSAQGGEEYTTAVVSSHRLSFDHRLSHEYRASLERRVSESASLRSLSMDSGGSEFCFSRNSSSGRRVAPGRRRAHEFAREDTYERDTSFYSEMACAPVTRLSGLSTSSAARVPSADLGNIEAEEEEMDKMVFRRRRDAYKEAWRRSASQDTSSLDGPARASAAATCALAGPGPPPLPMPPAVAGLRPAMPRIDSTDFANDELMRRNEIFCGRL